MNRSRKISINPILFILVTLSCHSPNDNNMHCIPIGHYYSHLELDTLYTPLISEEKYKEYVIYPDVMMVLHNNKGMDYRSIRSSNDSLFVYYPSGNVDIYKYKCVGQTLVLMSTTKSKDKVLVQIQSLHKPFEEIRNTLTSEYFDIRRDSILKQFFAKHE